MAIIIRPATAADGNYMISTMRETLLDSSAYCKGLHPRTMNAILEPILATFHAAVAVNSQEPSTVLGFVVYDDPQTVAFLYVMVGPEGLRLRRKGIGTALLRHVGTAQGEVFCPLMVTSLEGKNFQEIARAKGYRIRFRPYMPWEVSACLADGPVKGRIR